MSDFFEYNDHLRDGKGYIIKLAPNLFIME